MGKYYAETQGEATDVAAAIEEHYKPQGPNDRVPNSPVSIAVALVDKIDTLSLLLADWRKPTGSKDPYALRRAALGVIRIIIENSLRIRLNNILNDALSLVARRLADQNMEGRQTLALNELGPFFTDRLKVYLRDRGARHDVIEAAFASPLPDDLLGVFQRVEALGRSFESEDVWNLLAGYRRAANILRAEEKKEKDASVFTQPHNPGDLQLPEEKRLASANGETSFAVSTFP